MKVVSKKPTARLGIALCIVLAIIATFAVFIGNRTRANADSETLQEKIVRFTDSDLLDGEADGGVTVRNFAANYKTGAYSYNVTDILSKVIPLELFYTEGTHAYMGNDYGFVLITTYNAGGTGFQNALLIIDFQIDNDIVDGIVIPNQVRYRIEPLIQTYVETTNEQGSAPWKITQPSSYAGFDFKIRNISIGANLYNENELNDGDTYYNFDKDKGDVLSVVRMPYRAIYDTRGDDKAIGKWATKMLINKTLDMIEDSKIPYVSKGIEIIRKIRGYAQEGKDFFDSASKIDYSPKDISNGEDSQIIIESYLPKDGESGSQQESGKYARNVYLNLNEGYKDDDDTQGKSVYLTPSLNARFNDDGTLVQDNCYVDLVVKTQGEVSNSRIAFGSCFEIVYDCLGDTVLSTKSDGTYQFVPEGYSGTTPALMANGRDFKIYRKAPDMLKNESDAYLLDAKGYMLYEFQPKNGDNFAFGKYKFITDSISSLQPGRAFIFSKQRAQTVGFRRKNL